MIATLAGGLRHRPTLVAGSTFDASVNVIGRFGAGTVVVLTLATHIDQGSVRNRKAC
jgi:hypothetical protein